MVKMTQFDCVYKFFVNNFALVSYNNLKFVDKMDNIFYLMCIELNLVQYNIN